MIPPDDQLMSLGKPSLITQLKTVDAAYESVVVERNVLAAENKKLQTEVQRLEALLKEKDGNDDSRGKEFDILAKDLDKRLTEHLKKRALDDVDAQRLLDGIGMRQDNGQVLLFLQNPKVEPTNNMAERDLRGAVISRKNSQCSKNERGADTFAKMKSIFARVQDKKLLT